MTPRARSGVHVELYARQALPAPASNLREHVESRLAALAAAGAITSFDVTTWPKRIPRSGADQALRDRYLAFVSWAAKRGVKLRPAFDTRECYSMTTGERGDWIVLPAVCFAVFEEDELTAVYPHTAGDTCRSVLTGLASLGDAETGTLDPARTTAAD